MTIDEIKETLADSVSHLQELALGDLTSRDRWALNNVINFVNEILYDEIYEDDDCFFQAFVEK